MKTMRDMKVMLLMLLSIVTTLAFGQERRTEWVVCNNGGCQILDPYYGDSATIKWDGACVDGKADGFGKLHKEIKGVWESTYEGEYKMGVREGKGIFTHRDGTVKEGMFVAGELVGSGVLNCENGDHYVGEFLNYRLHGNGIYKYGNGSTFEGFFVSDQEYTGKKSSYNGEITYLEKGEVVPKLSKAVPSAKPEIGVRTTLYYDANWNRCEQKKASYYRLITYESENKPKGVVKDFYITGELQSVFNPIYLDCQDEGKTFNEGKSVWYYKNGKIEQITYNFNNKIDGLNTFFYETGVKKSETTYKIGVMNGLCQYWTPSGNLEIKAYYDQNKLVNNKYSHYSENGVESIIYNEPFYSNNSVWAKNDKNSTSIINSDGSVETTLLNDESYCRFNYIPLNQKFNYTITANIQKLTEKDVIGYGLIFGLSDWDNYYRFLISEKGMFKIEQFMSGVSIPITDWKESDAIALNNAKHELKVIKSEDMMFYVIDGEVVEATEVSELRGNNVGVMYNAKGKYLLERVEVEEIPQIEGDSTTVSNSFDSTNRWKGGGSGVFISENGYIATNYHVIKDAKDIEVEYLSLGTTISHKAKVVVSDKQNDLAIIKIDDSKFKALPKIPYVFSTQSQDVGSDIFTLGYPLTNVMGKEIKFTDGKISSRTGVQGDVRAYQISAPIQPGNSGGPLFDKRGNLVGINFATLNGEINNVENVNYAIKLNYLKSLIDVLPETISLPSDSIIYGLPLTEKIKVLSDIVPIIRVK